MRNPLSILIFLFTSIFLSTGGTQVASAKVDTAPADTLRQPYSHEEAILWSPDGHTLAVSIDKNVYLYNSDELQVPPILLEQATENVTAMIFNHDGTFLAMGHDGSEVDLWNAATRTHVANFSVGPGMVTSIFFTPDNRQVYVGTTGGVVRLINLDNLQEEPSASSVILDTQNLIEAISGTKVIVNSEYLSLDEIDWQRTSLKQVSILLGFNTSISPIVFSPSGNLVAGGGDYDVGTYLWDTSIGKIAAIIWPLVPSSSIAFSPDERYLATGTSVLFDPSRSPVPTPTQGGPTPSDPDETNLIGIWSIQEAIQRGSLEFTDAKWMLQGDTEEITGVAFSPDSSRLASISLDGILRIWDLSTGKQEAQTDLVTPTPSASSGGGG